MRTALLSAARWTAIVMTYIMIGIHLALVPMHLEEKFYIGVLFVVGSAVLCFVIVGLASDRSSLRSPAWMLGTAVSVVMFGAFVASRTVGLPEGYHESWASGIEDVLGLVSLAAEVVFVACAGLSLEVGVPVRRRTWMVLRDRTAPLR